MSASDLLPLEDALALIHEHVPVLPARQVPLVDSLGHELLQDVVADMDQPPFDRSAMDGYAVAGDGTDFEIEGELQPGDTPSIALSEGQALRVFTGAQIPVGATRVIMQELTQVDGTMLHETQRASTNFIRRQGEDAKKGKVLIRSGDYIRPVEASVMASVGVTHPWVKPCIRAMHLTTGNELVAPTATPNLNQIRDSNSTLIATILKNFSADLVHQTRISDDLETAVDCSSSVDQEEGYDLLLVSGGASVGKYDIGKPLLERLGYTIHFSKLDLRPGKPLVFATKKTEERTQVAFILPGNPVSHLVCFYYVVAEAFHAFDGDVWHPVDQRPRYSSVEATLREDFAYKPSHRLTYWPAYIHPCPVGEEVTVSALPWQSSGDMQALLPANAFLKIKSDQKLIPKGTVVTASSFE